MFRIGFVLLRRPELSARLTGLPRTRVAIKVVGRAQRKAFMLNLAASATSKRHKGRITTDPLLTTRRLHQRRRGIATETTMLAGNRLGFQPVVRHGIAFSGGGGAFVIYALA